MSNILPESKQEVEQLYKDVRRDYWDPEFPEGRPDPCLGLLADYARCENRYQMDAEVLCAELKQQFMKCSKQFAREEKKRKDYFQVQLQSLFFNSTLTTTPYEIKSLTSSSSEEEYGRLRAVVVEEEEDSGDDIYYNDDYQQQQQS